MIKIIKRLTIGFKKGLITPTLPENILKFNSNPFVRNFRFLGGLSIILLLGNSKKFTHYLYT